MYGILKYYGILSMYGILKYYGILWYAKVCMPIMVWCFGFVNPVAVPSELVESSGCLGETLVLTIPTHDTNCMPYSISMKLELLWSKFAGVTCQKSV